MNGGCDAHKADNEKRLNVRENGKKKIAYLFTTVRWQIKY